MSELWEYIHEYNKLLKENFELKNYSDQAAIIWKKIENKETTDINKDDVMKI